MTISRFASGTARCRGSSSGFATLPFSTQRRRGVQRETPRDFYGLPLRWMIPCVGDAPTWGAGPQGRNNRSPVRAQRARGSRRTRGQSCVAAAQARHPRGWLRRYAAWSVVCSDPWVPRRLVTQGYCCCGAPRLFLDGLNGLFISGKWYDWSSHIQLKHAHPRIQFQGADVYFPSSRQTKSDQRFATFAHLRSLTPAAYAAGKTLTTLPPTGQIQPTEPTTKNQHEETARTPRHRIPRGLSPSR